MPKGKSHLVPIKKIVIRDGKPYQTTVLVNPNKENTVTGNAVRIPEEWRSIQSIEDFDKARKAIFENKDVATKDILKREFVDHMEKSGVNWDRSEDFAIDYMRCMSKAKKMIQKGEFYSHGGQRVRRESKYEKMDKAEARSLVQTITKNVSREAIYKQMKAEGIEWKECNHPGINHMRAMMALRENLQDGKGFSMVNDKLKANKNYVDIKYSGKDGGGAVALSKEAIEASIKKDSLVKPKEEDFDDYDKYMEARDEWRKERKALRAKVNELTDEAIKKNLEREPIFKSKDEVRQWIKDMDCEYTEEFIETVDLRAYNDIVPIVEEMSKKYRELFDYGGKDGKVYKFLFDIDHDPGAFMSANGGLRLSKSFANYENALYSALYNISSGYNVYGDGTIRTLIRHEFGHNVQSVIIGNKYYDEWNNDGSLKHGGAEKRSEFDIKFHKACHGKEGMSEYAYTNDLEMFAEAFADCTSSKEQSEYAQNFRKLMKEYGVDV